MTIDEIYKYVKFLANKENRGWLKPSEFNMLAKRVQLDIIKDRVGRMSPDGATNGYRENSQFYDELRTIITQNANMGGGADSNGNGEYTFPSDYLYFLALTFNNRDVEILNHGGLMKRLSSHLNPPSAEYPVGIIYSGGVRVYIAPDSSAAIGDVNITYVSEPNTPNWAFTVINNIEIYNSSGSTDFELPESTHKEIIHRIVAYLGVQLREANMIEYGTSTVMEQNS
tara:strand:+ start:1604 stop:2284 length:681 start_codon:yes stop_codon:yes gene_type:complete